ncbi:polyamine aminopropyltransferase [filamentous cyanobacterium LEGE 11480]|uniref:Polyamine aminopropyltransferase n=1 Tax=Romeriopsis navalis LEGE 11480 TaxID=2777977 RepID=A0A928VRS5_9CYAN|nr:polyamine aminopropyltransferase [Romeriopsis navalis]MBE9033456.1 polyamine aminopropyltransferase [Romeriopsis navalis LEGE 11480]
MPELTNQIEPAPPQAMRQSQRWMLLAAAAVSSACGLAIELLLGTLASYLVGNQALAFGIAIGGFLAAMGLGSYLSRFVAVDDNPKQLLLRFIQVELAIAPFSFLVPIALFALFTIDAPFWIALVFSTIILGTLAGMEVPILTRMLEKDEGVRGAVSSILALDYIGALVGSLAFPLLLLPVFGMFPTAAVIASLPAFMVYGLGRVFSGVKFWQRVGLFSALFLCAIAPFTNQISDRLENNLYQAPIISRQQSPYQRIVLTRQGRDVRLFLDGDLQLSTLDEYRYHEALVHPAMAMVMASNPERRLNVLLMGAGDGMAMREILKWSNLDKVTLIDLDPAVVQLAKRHPVLLEANQQSFDDPRVRVQIGDALKLAPKLQEKFDVIIADFPDPDRDVLAKLYSKGFYQALGRRLVDDGVLVTQASSSFFAPKVLACIHTTLQAAGFEARPYVAEVPSFGPWGFVMARSQAIAVEGLKLPIETRFLTEGLMKGLFELPKDVAMGGVEVNRLSRPVILKYQDNPRWSAYD